MTNRRIKPYWHILIALLLIGCIVLSAGESQAHYVNTQVLNTVVEAEANAVTSNCLVDVAATPVTVLLGEMPIQEVPVEITLDSARDMSGSLTWSADNGEYLDIKMSSGDTVLESGDTLELKADSAAVVTMTLAPSQMALVTVDEPMEINITVNWADRLQGNFRVTLPALTQQAAATVQPEPASANVQTTASNPAQMAQETDNPDAVEAAEGSDELPDSNTESTDPVEETTPQAVLLETVNGFAPKAELPLRLSVAEEITQAKLGTGIFSALGLVMQPFPAYTCYSTDNGTSYYMLYYPDTITMASDESKQLSILLDFSRTALATGTEVVMAAEGYAGQVSRIIAAISVPTNTDAFFQIDSRVLTKDSSVTIMLNKAWKDYAFTYSVERLSSTLEESEEVPEEETGDELTEEGESLSEPKYVLEYVEVDASQWCEFVSDEETYTLTFQLSETLPPAGTYRVNMNWSYEETCFAKTQATFFINYSVYSESEETGGTEQ